ncbi:MAG: endonuclease III [Alphaproteobacteria bacterium]|nr:endonuclease III [Alphaproteobacteria bacterium]
MDKKTIQVFFKKLSLANPKPKGELDYINPYTLLIAVVLSAQATDKGVNKATQELFKKIDNPYDMVKLGEQKLKEYIKTIGLYNMKAKNVIALSHILVDQYDGKVPENLEILQTLPGVGRKTANVVLNIAFDHPTIAVDTHVFRVANRTGLAPGPTPLAVEKMLERNVPKIYKKYAHHWLILHGRYVCKARNPLCFECIVHKECDYFKDQKLANL